MNIKCPKPLKNVFGKYYSVEELGKTKHLVRLLEYIPGKILYEVPPKDHLFYQAGEFIGKLDNALKVSIFSYIFLFKCLIKRLRNNSFGFVCSKIKKNKFFFFNLSSFYLKTIFFYHI